MQLVVLFSLSPTLARADVKLPAVIDSHMVMQRDIPVVIWGEAKPGEAVTARHGDASAETNADVKGGHVHDLYATVLHLLGIEHTELTFRHAGRDFRLTDVSDKVVSDIIA